MLLQIYWKILQVTTQNKHEGPEGCIPGFAWRTWNLISKFSWGMLEWYPEFFWKTWKLYPSIFLKILPILFHNLPEGREYFITELACMFWDIYRLVCLQTSVLMKTLEHEWRRLATTWDTRIHDRNMSMPCRLIGWNTNLGSRRTSGG